MGNQNTESIESLFPTLPSKQAFLVGLFARCPMNKNIETCPAYELRELPTADKIELVFEMDEEKLDEIITHHMNCMEQKPN